MSSKLNNPSYLADLPGGGPREFFTAAKLFLNTHNTDWVWIDAGSEQHRAWAGYLFYKGWRLRFMQHLGGDLNRVTMPAEWPELFDLSYVASS